jgi:hypothetical protein
MGDKETQKYNSYGKNKFLTAKKNARKWSIMQKRIYLILSATAEKMFKI